VHIVLKQKDTCIHSNCFPRPSSRSHTRRIRICRFRRVLNSWPLFSCLFLRNYFPVVLACSLVGCEICADHRSPTESLRRTHLALCSTRPLGSVCVCGARPCSNHTASRPCVFDQNNTVILTAYFPVLKLAYVSTWFKGFININKL
jgi:hypothetical protein